MVRDDFKCPPLAGLRLPASASCLERHARLAGRCPNNSSLFPPLAAVVVVALWPYSAEKLFYNFGIPERLRTLRYSIFTGGSWLKTAFAAPLSAKARHCGGKFFADFQRAELPQSKPDGFDSSLWEGAFGIAGKFAVKLQSLRACLLPLGGAVAQRLRGCKSAEPEKNG